LFLPSFLSFFFFFSLSLSLFIFLFGSIGFGMRALNLIASLAALEPHPQHFLF
jgi:hypothetical protein